MSTCPRSNQVATSRKPDDSSVSCTYSGIRPVLVRRWVGTVRLTHGQLCSPYYMYYICVMYVYVRSLSQQPPFAREWFGQAHPLLHRLFTSTWYDCGKLDVGNWDNDVPSIPRESTAFLDSTPQEALNLSLDSFELKCQDQSMQLGKRRQAYNALVYS